MRFTQIHGDTVTFSGESTSFEFEGPKQPTESKQTLIVNLQGEHPYAFFPPWFSETTQTLIDKPDLMGKIKSTMRVESIVFLIPDKKSLHNLTWRNPQQAVSKFCHPEYPVTQAWVESMTGIPRADFHLLDWFSFQALLCRLGNQPLPGLPVIITFPESRKTFHGLAGRAAPLENLIGALPTPFRDMKGEGFLCIDHPFTGNLVPEDLSLNDVKPYSFIVLPKNRKKKIPFLQTLKLMIREPLHFHFNERYNSSPRQLGTPCQKCLHCGKICPAGIVPFMIAALFDRELIKEASRFQPEACIECGLCSYVCPSGIPLLHSIKTLKKKLRIVS